MDKNVRILIVEDEFVTLDLLRDYLEESGYEVSGDAMSADEAIKILEKGETDFAMLDINIKGDKNGIWVAEQIQKKYKMLMVKFLSENGLSFRNIMTFYLNKIAGFQIFNNHITS